MMPLILPDAIGLGVFAVMGLLLGSFLTVVITRLPRLERFQLEAEGAPADARPLAPPNLWLPHSFCPHCQTPLNLGDNIPLVGFWRQRGQCRHCQARISRLYPWVEGLSALLGGLVWFRFGWDISAVAGLVCVLGLLALAFIDGRELVLPDGLTQPLLWLGLFAAWNGSTGDFPARLDAAVAGAMVGYGSLWLLYQAFFWLTGREGLGQGDLKLLAAIGAWVGLPRVFPIVFLASVLGLVTAITLLLLKRRRWHDPLPFGSFLAVAAIGVILLPPSVANAFWAAIRS